MIADFLGAMLIIVCAMLRTSYEDNAALYRENKRLRGDMK